MKVTALVENTCAPHARGLRKEPGLSMYIEHADKQILFDTGLSDAFADNAAKLGVDLAAVDVAVISHHHFDHGGGLRHFMRLNPRAPIVLARRPQGECVLSLFGLRKSVGLDPRMFEEHAARFTSVILNMVDAAVTAFPGRPLKAVFGGFHLTILPILPFMDGSRAEVTELARKLLSYSPAHVHTGHCTGAHAFEVLKGVMGPRLEYFSTGTCVEV